MKGPSKAEAPQIVVKGSGSWPAMNLGRTLLSLKICNSLGLPVGAWTVGGISISLST